MAITPSKGNHVTVLGEIQSTVGDVVKPATYFLRQQFPVTKNAGLYSDQGLFYIENPKTATLYKKKYGRPVDVHPFDGQTAENLPFFKGVRDVSVGFVTAGDEHYWPFVAPDESQGVLVTLHYDDDLEAIIGTTPSCVPRIIGYQTNHWMVRRPSISPFVVSVSQGEEAAKHPLEEVDTLQQDILRYFTQTANGLGITPATLHCRVESHLGKDKDGHFSLIRFFPSYAVPFEAAQRDTAHSHSLKFALAEKGLFTRMENWFEDWPEELE